MKTIKIVPIVLFMGIALTANAQEKVEKYSFTVYLSNGTASSCTDIDRAYVSPIVSHQFEKYLDYDYVDDRDLDDQTDELEEKWAKKVQAEFDIDNTYCWGSYEYVWEDSRSDVDEKRDEVMIELNRQDYTVRDDYWFSFYF